MIFLWYSQQSVICFKCKTDRPITLRYSQVLNNIYGGKHIHYIWGGAGKCDQFFLKSDSHLKHSHLQNYFTLKETFNTSEVKGFKRMEQTIHVILRHNFSFKFKKFKISSLQCIFISCCLQMMAIGSKVCPRIKSKFVIKHLAMVSLKPAVQLLYYLAQNLEA